MLPYIDVKTLFLRLPSSSICAPTTFRRPVAHASRWSKFRPWKSETLTASCQLQPSVPWRRVYPDDYVICRRYPILFYRCFIATTSLTGWSTQRLQIFARILVVVLIQPPTLRISSLPRCTTISNGCSKICFQRNNFKLLQASFRPNGRSTLRQHLPDDTSNRPMELDAFLQLLCGILVTLLAITCIRIKRHAFQREF